MLIESVRVIHDTEGLRTTLVFDGDSLQIEYPYKAASFTVLYASKELSADGVIERLVANSAQPKRILVITRDRMIADTITVFGAEILSPDAFWKWIERCRDVSSSILARQWDAQKERWGQKLDW